MSVDRRRFLGLLATLPVVGPKLFEMLAERRPPFEDVRLVKYTARVEITEEALRKVEASKRAFESWAEDERPRMSSELDELVAKTFEGSVQPVADFETLVMEELLEQNEAEGRYLETAVSL